MENLMQLNAVSIALRLMLAMLCGGVLGIDREKNRSAAGFRTYTLVCVGAAMVMMTSQYVVEKTVMSGDIFRMGAQVVSGIGFLGAGTIIVTGHRQVKGLTTAAGLWVAACIGLAIGIGFYSGALLGTVLILLVLTWFHYLEEKIDHRSHVMRLYIEMENTRVMGRILCTARENFLQIADVELERDTGTESEAVLLISISYHGVQSHDTVLHLMNKTPGVRRVEEY